MGGRQRTVILDEIFKKNANEKKENQKKSSAK